MTSSDVNITGVNGQRVPEWALEDTLQDCRDYLRTMSNFAEKDFQDDKRDDKKTEKHRKKLEKELKDMGQASKGFGAGAFRKQIVDAFAAGGGTAYERVLRRSMGGFMKSAGIFGIIVTGLYEGVEKLADIISDVHRAYLSVYDSGISLNGSFIDLIDGAATAHMSIDQYSAALTEYSNVIHNLSSETTRGAETWGMLNNQVRQILTQGNMGMLGMTMSDVNDYMSEYLEIQQLMGINEQIDFNRRSKNISGYLIELTKLSQITGKHRKQLQDELMEAQREDRWVAFLAAQEEGTREQLGSMLNHFAALGPEWSNLFKDMTMGVYSEESKHLMSMSGALGQEIQKMASNAANGVQYSSDEMTALIGRMREYGQKELKERGESLGKLAGAEHAATATWLRAISRLQKTTTDEEALRKEFGDTLTSLIAQWDDIKARLFTPFLKLFGDFMTGLNTSGGVLDEFAQIVRDSAIAAASFFEDIAKSEDFQKFIEDASKWLGELVVSIRLFMEDLFSEGGIERLEDKLVDGIGKLLGYIGEAIGSGIKKALPWWLGGGDEEEQKGPSLEERQRRQRVLDELGSNIETLGPPYAKGGIANSPAIFGEKGPEAAIPLDGGRRIPIAELKGDFNKEEMKEMIRLLQDLGKKLDMQTEISRLLNTNLSKLTSATKSQSGVLF